MAQSDTPVADETLQFDRAVAEFAVAGAPPSPVVVCAGCKLRIQTQYHDVNGNHSAAHVEPPSPPRPSRRRACCRSSRPPLSAPAQASSARPSTTR